MPELAPEAAARPLTTVIFDLGGVVLSWAPHLAYEQVLPAADVEAFLTRIDFYEWNRVRDTGALFSDGEAELIARFPDDELAIRAYREHFSHALTGLVPGTGAVLAGLQQSGVRLLALTNWSAETFTVARERFGLLDRFEGIVVSGAERVVKPEPEIFRLLCQRYEVEPAECVFVDDSPTNVAAAGSLGLTALAFTDAERLRADLQELRMLDSVEPVTNTLFHVTEREVWRTAQLAGDYPWSSRGLSYDRQGFVHCSFARQVPGVVQRYADLDPADLVVLELDDRPRTSVVVEEGEPGVGFPHLFAPLATDEVSAVHDLARFAARPAG